MGAVVDDAAAAEFHEFDEAGFLVYLWTLKPGRTVPAGTFTFAGQYNHAEGGRDAGRDDYTVRAGASAGAPGQQAAAGGDFSVTR